MLEKKSQQVTYKTSPRPTTTRLCPQELNRLRDRQELTGNNDNNISPFPSMPALPPPPGLGPFIPPPPFLQPPPSVLIHFNHHHHHDLIIHLVIFIFLHNFHLQILAIGTKDYLEIYLVHRHRLLLEKKAKEKFFRIVFKKNQTIQFMNYQIHQNSNWVMVC